MSFHSSVHKKKPVKDHELIFCGNYLLSHVVSNEVPSAFERLTTVFGMGTGGTVQASSPHLLECCTLKTSQKKL